MRFRFCVIGNSYPRCHRGRPSEWTSVACATSSHFGGAVMLGPIWDLLSPSPGIVLSPSVPGSLWGSGLLSTQAPDSGERCPLPGGTRPPSPGRVLPRVLPPGVGSALGAPRGTSLWCVYTTLVSNQKLLVKENPGHQGCWKTGESK